MSMNELSALFSFIGGLGMFLFGMHIMSDGLQKSAGEKSRRFIYQDVLDWLNGHIAP